MPISSVLQRPWVRFALVFLAWTLYGIQSIYQTYLYLAVTGREVMWRPLLASVFSFVWFWAAMTPAILWLAKRFRVERQNWGRPLLVLIACGIGFAVLDVTYDFVIAPLVRGGRPESFLGSLLWQFDLNFFYFFAVVAISHAYHYYGLYRERRFRATELETRLVTAELQMLKMQLQPHFLFNTLHAISELVHEDPDAAERMITRLGDLLRLTIDSSGHHEVPLRQELEFLRAYIEIEQTRFRDRLTVDFEIEPDARDVLVPSLVLQPLVENAIRHGTSPQAVPGRIRVIAGCRGGRLLIEVRDNGVGLSRNGMAPREGIGLANTRARLEQLYGAAHQFEVFNGEDVGVVARLVIPSVGAAPAVQRSALEQTTLEFA